MRALSIPAFIVGTGLAIGFFKFYGVVTRPDVPTPIAVVVGQFAPGVEIGAKVHDVRRAVGSMTYVPHLGFVGIPGERETNLPDNGKVRFAQVRLLVDEEARLHLKLDPRKARIDAVEIVSVQDGAAREIGNAMQFAFRKAPHMGCLSAATDDAGYRDVQLWTTMNERGGVALISDFGETGNARYPGLMITSVIAFTGKFDGSRTLRGNYSDSACDTLAKQ